MGMATLRKDGRYVSRKMVDGKTTPGYGATPEEADADLARKLQPRSTELESTITLHEFATKIWWPHFEKLAPQTGDRYSRCYADYIRPFLGKQPVKLINSFTIHDWIERLREKGETEYTIQYAHGRLRSILTLAMRLELTERNPASLVSVAYRQVKREKMLELDEAVAFLEASKLTRLSAPIFLASVLGLRRGEIAALRWDDLDRRKLQLRVHRQRYALTGKGIVEGPCKRARARTLLLTPGIVAEIDARGDLDGEFVSTNAGLPWVPNHIDELWGGWQNKGMPRHPGIRESHNMKDWTFHDLRHLAAGLLAAAGCDLLMIGAVLGHARPDITALYTSVSSERTREALGRVSALLGGRSCI